MFKKPTLPVTVLVFSGSTFGFFLSVPALEILALILISYFIYRYYRTHNGILTEESNIPLFLYFIMAGSGIGPMWLVHSLTSDISVLWVHHFFNWLIR